MTRAIHWLFWFFSLSVALVSLRILILPVGLTMPNMAHYLPEAPLALFVHVLGGPLALALAPFQLWQGLRAGRRSLHRALGYGYAVTVLMAGLGTLALMPHYKGTLWSVAGFTTLALAWMGATGWGIWKARRKDQAAHRRWMLYSVAMAFAAVTLRIMTPPMIAAGWTITETYEITAWVSWIINLVALEWWMLRHRSPRGALMQGTQAPRCFRSVRPLSRLALRGLASVSSGHGIEENPQREEPRGARGGEARCAPDRGQHG